MVSEDKDSRGYSLADYSFSDGWGKRDPNQFNPYRLNNGDKEYWAETLGLAMDLVPSLRSDRIALRANPWSEEQLEFFAERMVEGVDFIYNGTDDDRRFPTMYIHNPAIKKYFHESLPEMGPALQTSLLSGVVSNAAFRTDHTRKGHKIITVTPIKQVFDSTVDLSLLSKMQIFPRSYLDEDGVEKHSVWFLNPEDMHDYILDDFDHLHGFLDKMPDPDYRTMFLEVTNFHRGQTLRRMRNEGKLKSKISELIDEQQSIRRELKDLENVSADTDKNELERRYDDIEKRLLAGKNNKRRRSNSYANKIHKNARAKEKAGE